MHAGHSQQRSSGPDECVRTVTGNYGIYTGTPTQLASQETLNRATRKRFRIDGNSDPARTEDGSMFLQARAASSPPPVKIDAS